MYTMPGLTESVLLETAEQMHLFIHGQLVNLSEQQWIEWQGRCEQKLGLQRGWEDVGYRRVVEEEKKRGWGITYGPGLGGYKKKSKESSAQKQGRLW